MDHDENPVQDAAEFDDALSDEALDRTPAVAGVTATSSSRS